MITVAIELFMEEIEMLITTHVELAKWAMVFQMIIVIQEMIMKAS